MSADRRYLACPQRPGSPRVALEVCRICPKAKRCQAWRDFTCPALFPGLEAQRPPAASRAARPAVTQTAAPARQAALPMADL